MVPGFLFKCLSSSSRKSKPKSKGKPARRTGAGWQKTLAANAEIIALIALVVVGLLFVDFVRRGGSLVISGGDQVTADRYDAALGSILHAMEHLVWWVCVLAVVWLVGAAVARYSRDRQ